MHHRWPARLFVIALHAGLLAALWLHRAPQPGQGERRLVTLRLLPPKVAAAPPRESRPLPVARTVAPVPAAVPIMPAIPLPADTQPSTAITLPPPEVAAPAAAPPRAPLRLTLPPGYAASAAAARNPALDDPRSNTPRLTLEDRIADATGGAGAWVEEKTSENNVQAVGALGEHRSVMRRGNTCVEIFRSRISDTDPFNGNVAPRAPRMMGKPYKCR